MKTHLKFLLIMIVLAGFVFLTSCTNRIAAKGVNNLKKPIVQLHVVGNPKELKVITPGDTNCKARNPANGCIAVGKRETALIKFELKTSPDWYFSEFKICRGSSKDTQDCNLENWEQVEFFAADTSASKLLFPDGNGIIDLEQLSSSTVDFYLFDFNSVEQDFFYTIKVCNSGASPQCIWTDPDIENKGRN